MVRPDGRIVLALHAPRGDWAYVAVVHFAEGSGLPFATEVEIVPRETVFVRTEGTGRGKL